MSVPRCSLKNGDGGTLRYPAASTHQIQNFAASIVQLQQKKKRNSVQEYTDWGIVPMKGQVIIYFPLVFKFHQLKSHLPRQLSHFKKNSQESIKQYQEEKEVR